MKDVDITCISCTIRSVPVCQVCGIAKYCNYSLIFEKTSYKMESGDIPQTLLFSEVYLSPRMRPEPQKTVETCVRYIDRFTQVCSSRGQSHL